MQAPQSARVYQFGAFDVDLARGELRKRGVRIRLQEQPFQILVMLLEHAGELVSREELYHKLWPPDTFVDFEQGLGTAIKKLRQALGDDADTPRYIETVPKRGYRFIAAVEKLNEIPPTAKDSTAEIPPGHLSQPVSVPNAPVHRRRWWLLALLLAVATAFLLIWVFPREDRDKPLMPKPRQLTANSTENTVIQSTLSPDGRVIAYGDQSGIHLQVIATRETWNVPRPRAFSRDDSWWPIAFFPDGNRLLVGSAEPTPQGLRLAAWIVLIHSGRATRIRKDCIAQSVSPDGTLIAFTSGGIGLRDEIWVMKSDGQGARKVGSAKDTVFSLLRWSRDGRRLAYRKEGVKESRDVPAVVESIAISGGPPVTIEAHADRWGDFCWLPQGRLIFARAPETSPDEGMNLWEISTDPIAGTPKGPPRELTDWVGFGIEHLTLSSDASRLAFDKASSQTDVYVGQVRGRGFAVPPRRFTLDDYDDFPFAWSRDSKTVFFTIDRPGFGSILRQDLDQDQPEPIMSGSNIVGAVRITPDGSSLLYIDYEGNNSRLLLLPLSGGLPQVFGQHQKVLNVACAQQPATNCIAGVLDSVRQRFVMFRIDPPDQEFHRLFDVDFDLRLDPSWTVSPDGTRIAFNKNLADGAEIDVVDLSGRRERPVPVRGFNRLRSIDWAPDGRSWFVGAETSTGCALLRVYPDGTYSVLVNMHGRGMRTYAIPSPNGEHVAFLGWTVNRNAWMIDRPQNER